MGENGKPGQELGVGEMRTPAAHSSGPSRTGQRKQLKPRAGAPVRLIGNGSGWEASVGIIHPRPFPEGTGLWLSTWSWLGVVKSRGAFSGALIGPHGEADGRVSNQGEGGSEVEADCRNVRSLPGKTAKDKAHVGFVVPWIPPAPVLGLREDAWAGRSWRADVCLCHFPHGGCIFCFPAVIFAYPSTISSLQ